jgi:hypothetical protein
MRIWILIVFSACLQAIDLDTIPDNTWLKLNVAYSYPPGYTGAHNLRFWCSFTWDADSERILFWEGYIGSHNQVSGSIYANAVYELKPAAETVRMLKLSTYWDNPGYNVFNPGSGPVTPFPRHTWGSFRYIPEYKSVYLGSGACGGGAGSWICSDFWKYHIPTDSFIKIDAVIQDSALIRPGYAVRYNYFPGSDTLWAFAGDVGSWVQAYAFNLATEVWSSRINYGPRTYGLAFTAEDPSRGQILVWTAQGFFFMDRAMARMERIANQPDTSLLSSRGSDGVMAYIPKHDCYFIYDPDSAQVWVMHPADTSWTRVTDNNDPGKRIDMYFAYDPVNDVVATFNVSGEFHVFRYKPDGSSAAGPAVQAAGLPGLFVSPNPAGRTAWISLKEKKAAEVRIYDLKGRLCGSLRAAANSGRVAWNAAGMPAGVYTAVVLSGSSRYSQKFILAH